MKQSSLFFCLSLFGTAPLNAQIVVPTSYDMLNGSSGSFNYWDDSYSGAGDPMVNGSSLTGGLGDLTDSVIATDNWNVVEGPSGPNGPYVGWQSINPTITFNFASVEAIDEIRIYADDPDGYGGVTAPASVDVFANEVLSSHGVTDPVGSVPFMISIDTTGLETDQIALTLVRNGSWVFISEVEFIGPAIPEPSSIAFLGGFGTLLLLGFRRRR